MADTTEAEKSTETKEIIEIENINLENIDLAAALQHTLDWCSNYLFQANTIYQGVIIVASFIFGMFIYRMTRATVEKAINDSDWPRRIKRIANNVRKLLFPLITLIVIFLTTRIASSDLVGVDVSLINGMMKVLTAWIVIRILAQFIDNNTESNVFAFGLSLIHIS